MTRTHRFLSGFVTGYAHLILATIAGLWLTPFFLHHLGQSTYGLWLVGTQLVAYLLLMDLGIVALLPRETAYITGRTGGQDAPELRQLIEKTLPTRYLRQEHSDGELVLREKQWRYQLAAMQFTRDSIRVAFRL